MAQLVGNDEIESLRVELAEIGRSLIWGHRFSAIALVSEAFQLLINNNNCIVGYLKERSSTILHQTEQSCNYISADMFSKKFKESPFGKKLDEELSKPFSKPHSHKNAISFSNYSLSKWALIRACMSGELLLMRWNSFIYVFKSTHLVIIASVAMTVFLQTRMNVDAIHANYYLGALFYAVIILFFDGFPELSLTVRRLAVFYKQRDLYFYPAWAYAIPATILKVPISLSSALIWTSLTYYVIGYSPEAGRFFLQCILFLALHLAATSMFCFLASVFRTAVASTTAGSLFVLFVLLFSGFIIPKCKLSCCLQPLITWLKWGFWVSPLTYGEVGLALNEFLAPRWQKVEWFYLLNPSL
ncbi:Pleiotropic drug resistance protein 3 [Camellia lanceoleosa]|uniref:Pleiotropic drug resistance protein 3 n=1 Tax=Camellia lanceoleosa TaxID=1840588 RepID=A0ACC0IPC2_9ERIC|nr:Pleiotropic drug resistance protein 3 [Camellia lanceoleosa]